MMKLGALVDKDFVRSLNALNSKELPSAVAYKIAKITRKAAEEQKEYFRLRSAVIAKYVQKNEDGSNKIIKVEGKDLLDFGDHKETVGKELTELEDVEITIEKIKVSDLLKVATLTGGQINDLYPILEE